MSSMERKQKDDSPATVQQAMGVFSKTAESLVNEGVRRNEPVEVRITSGNTEVDMSYSPSKSGKKELSFRIRS